MAIDDRARLFIPNKSRDADISDNWRVLERWGQPPTFKQLTLLNSWATVASATLPSYGIDGFGTVHMRGQIRANAPASSQIFAVLPPGFRPAHQHNILGVGVSGGGLYGVMIAILATGECNMTPITGAPAYTTFTNVLLDNIHFNLQPTTV